MQTIDLTRKRELQKLANARGYSLRTRRPTKNARGYWLRRTRAGLGVDDFHYEVSEGWAGVLCRDLDDVEDVVRDKKSIRQQATEADALMCRELTRDASSRRGRRRDDTPAAPAA
jgi:hypothetical protein